VCRLDEGASRSCILRGVRSAVSRDDRHRGPAGRVAVARRREIKDSDDTPSPCTGTSASTSPSPA
jgi:hypothetical protein